MGSNNNRQGYVRRFTGALKLMMQQRPFTGAMVMFVVGILFWGAFNTALVVTNTESFCISCHEMRENVYKEYRKTVHFSNPTGVRATCPDCHVPREWVYKVARKIKATNELFHKIVGTVDTPEKFRQRRLQLAQHVWKNMKETDSRECRNCHSFKSMALKKQSRLASLKHARSIREGKTCIDCHMGVAHKMPYNFDADGKIHDGFKKSGRACGDCHKGMARAPD